jgi:hypothetical protein
MTVQILWIDQSCSCVGTLWMCYWVETLQDLGIEFVKIKQMFGARTYRPMKAREIDGGAIRDSFLVMVGLALIDQNYTIWAELMNPCFQYTKNKSLAIETSSHPDTITNSLLRLLNTYIFHLSKLVKISFCIFRNWHCCMYNKIRFVDIQRTNSTACRIPEGKSLIVLNHSWSIASRYFRSNICICHRHRQSTGGSFSYTETHHL